MRSRFLAILAAANLLAQQPAAPPQTNVVFKAETNLVVVNVAVRDKAGKAVDKLKATDFTVLEDGKPQKIGVFEFQKLETIEEAKAAGTEPKPSTELLTPVEEKRKQQITIPEPGSVQYQNKRLLVLFFDFGGMATPDQLRAQEAALKYVDEKIAPSDMVAIMTMASSVKVEQDFTQDKDLLRAIIGAFRIGEMSEMAGLADNGDDDTNDDTGAAFVADQSEFNMFNTDRKLAALEDACKKLAPLPEKKALVYFSSGIAKNGIENQSQIRSTINAAIRSNVSFYTVDTSGLSATPPGGDASKPAPRGTGLYSGATQRALQTQRHDQQETLSTLAADTGGKAFLDSNDLTLGIVQAQKDVRSYYILGYYSTNSATDGRFRRITVKLNGGLTARLDYRAGYYAEKVWGNFNRADKEKQLEEALTMGNPVTDIPLALEVDFFRLSRSRYFVPVSLKLPGFAISLTAKGGGQGTDIDFMGQILDEKKRNAGSVRDGIKIKLTPENAELLAKKSLQYDTGFTLAPGTYRMKILARDNNSGKMGTFETRFTVPDLNPDPLPLPMTDPALTIAGSMETGNIPMPVMLPETAAARISSVVWSNQREPIAAAVGSATKQKKLLNANPLVSENQKLIPNITRVFRKDQNLYVYFEVYDTTKVAATLSIFDTRGKRFESAPVEIAAASGTRFQTVPVQLQVPLTKLKAGRYICQVNVIDEDGKKFAFPRAPLVLVP